MKMLKQTTYKPCPKFLERVVDQSQHSLKVFKTYLLISVFAILMVSISCGGGGPSSVASTPPLDGDSEQFDPICPNGIVSTTKVSTANTEKCASCDEGFEKNGEACGGFDPICPNGVASTTETVNTANIEKCVSCDDDFEKNGEICGGFDPICPNGVKSPTKVSTDNTEKCMSCNPGFGMDGELCSEQFDPMCTNGVASTTTKFFTANTQKCTSCNPYYFLKSDETCATATVSMLAGGGTAATQCLGVAATNSITCRDSDPTASPSNSGGTAQFSFPHGVGVDRSGNVYVADQRNDRIRKITSTGMVSTLAGGGTAGAQCLGDAATGNSIICRDSLMSSSNPGGTAQFYFPSGVAVDRSGNVYVADLNNHRIREITPGGVVSTLAGTDVTGDFNRPHGVAVDDDGNVYVADETNHRIRKITSTGVVSTLAGGGTTGTPCSGTIESTTTCRDSHPTASPSDPGGTAQFNTPRGVAVDSDGNVYVADTLNHRIRKITSTGVVSTLAGSSSGFRDDAGNIAQFNGPFGVAVDDDGNVYVADTDNNRIRKIEISMGGGVEVIMVSTLAGTGSSGSANGDGNMAQFDDPRGVVVDGNDIYVADTQNHLIRKITIPQ